MSNQAGRPVPPASQSYSVLQAVAASSAVRELYSRRTRRVTFATQLDGPLQHTPVVDGPIPGAITKEEEAYLVAAAVGITGPLQADLPYTPEGVGRTMMNLYGRTIASPDASHTQRLIVLNDEGSWFIKGPQDFDPQKLPDLVKLVHEGNWLDWYDLMRVQISKRRADIPREIPYQYPFNFHSTNLPGTVYFIPVADLSSFFLNALFSGFEDAVGAVLRDLRNGLDPAGIDESSFRRYGGPLNDVDWDLQGTVEFLSESIRGWVGNERGQMFANLARAAQELNLDGFPHFGGQLRAWAEELDFQMLRVPTEKLTRGSSKFRYLLSSLFLKPTPYSWMTWLRPKLRRRFKRYADIPLGLKVEDEWLLQPYCPPYYDTMEEAVGSFVADKFDRLRTQLHAAVSDLDPNKAQAVDQALTSYTREQIRRVAGLAQYCLDRYGVFPYCGEPGPLASLEAFQVHVADPAYYKSHYRTPLTQKQIERATFQLADGTNAGVAPARATAPVQVDGGPPWEFEADHIMLIYDVDADRVSGLIRERLGLDFEPVSQGGKAEIFVGFNRMVDMRSTDLKWVPPYDEIMVNVRVRHTSGAEGTCYLILHLDQRVPIDMGIVHVGYPKERAHIQRYEHAGRIQYRAQRPDRTKLDDDFKLYDLEITPREKIGERLRALAVWALYQLGQAFLDPGATCAFFQRNGELVQTRSRTVPKPFAMRLVKLERVDFPFLVDDLKILTGAEALTPKLAMHSHTSNGRSEIAEPIPSRVSAWVRVRLTGMGWMRPLTDRVVSWLNR